MAGIKDYSTTPASNTALFPENMAAAQVNNNARQVQADIRTWYEDAQWINLGNTPTYVSGTSFTINADVTATYTVNRRIRASGTTPFDITGTITASSYSSPNTTITVVWDSDSLDNTLDTVYIGILSPTSSASLVTQAQVRDGDFTELSSVSGTDEITATAFPTLSAYAQGQEFSFIAAGDNTTGVTIDIDSVGTANIVKRSGDALIAGDLISGAVHKISYDGSNFQLLTPNSFTSVNQTIIPDTDDSYDIGTTAARFQDIYLSGGVFIGGTGAANQLTDYESGTFTPEVTSSGGTFTPTYAVQDGHYVKVGDLVFVAITVSVSSVSGTPSGNLGLSGLPFATPASSPPSQILNAVHISGVDPYGEVSNSRSFYLGVSEDGTTGTFFVDVLNSTQTTVPSTNFTSAFQFRVFGCYKAA